MRFFIKEWPDQTATLMTEAGRIIWTFDCVASASRGGIEWAGIEEKAPRSPGVATTPPLGVAA